MLILCLSYFITTVMNGKIKLPLAEYAAPHTGMGRFGCWLMPTRQVFWTLKSCLTSRTFPWTTLQWRNWNVPWSFFEIVTGHFRFTLNRAWVRNLKLRVPLVTLIELCGCQLVLRTSKFAGARAQRWCSEFRRVPGTRGNLANSSPAKDSRFHIFCPILF